MATTKTTIKTTTKSAARATAARATTAKAAPAALASSGFSTYPLPELVHLWQHNHLTPEQMIGHLLQHVAELEQRVRQLEQTSDF